MLQLKRDYRRWTQGKIKPWWKGGYTLVAYFLSGYEKIISTGSYVAGDESC